jgi:hypothetical protein
MTSETPLDKLVMLEYRVEESQRLVLEGAEVVVYFIEGFGLSTYIRSDDSKAWAALVDGHEERVSSIEQEL